MVHTNNGYELTNIKVYELSALDNLVELQAIIDFIVAWNYPMVMYSQHAYIYRYKSTISWNKNRYFFYDTRPYAWANAWVNRVDAPYIQIDTSQNWDNVIEAQKLNTTVAYYLSTNNPTTTVVVPTADNHPANKKYVDDGDTALGWRIDTLQDQFNHFVQWWTTLPLSSLTNLEQWQAILDFVYVQNWVVYVLYNNKYYAMNKSSATTLTFTNMDFDVDWFYVNTLTFTFDANHECQSIATGHKNIMTVSDLPVDIDDDTLYLVKGS